MKDKAAEQPTFYVFQRIGEDPAHIIAGPMEEREAQRAAGKAAARFAPGVAEHTVAQVVFPSQREGR